MFVLPTSAWGRTIEVPVCFATDRDVKDGAISNEVSDFHAGITYGIAHVPVEITDDEYRQLDHSIEERGIRSPIVVSFDKMAQKLHWNAQTKLTSPTLEILDKQSALSQIPTKNVLVFTHGFATTFDAAIQKAAQIEVFSRRPVVLYTWPSQGGATPPAAANPLIKIGCAPCVAYSWDLQRMLRSRPNFLSFLNDMTMQFGSKNVSILAHSMGNALLFDAFIQRSLRAGMQDPSIVPETEAALRAALDGNELKTLIRPDADLSKFKLDELKRLYTVTLAISRSVDKFASVYMLAPDVDLAMFRKSIGPFLANASETTLMASRSDMAMKASRIESEQTRLGASTFKPTDTQRVIKALRIIDCSNIGNLNEFNHNIRPDILGALLNANPLPQDVRKSENQGLVTLSRVKPSEASTTSP